MTTILWEQQVQKSDQEVFFAEAGAIALCGYVIVESGGYGGMWVGESSNKSDLEILMHVWVLGFWENVDAYFLWRTGVIKQSAFTFVTLSKSRK